MKVGQHPKADKPKACEFKSPVALMLTYNRTGMVTKTVESFKNTAPEVPLHIFDDGSESYSKRLELWCIRKAKVHRLPHRGFVESWRSAFEFVRGLEGYDSVITIEDDVRFADGWLDVLKRMQAGINDLGWLQGMTSCFRPHSVQQGEIVDLRGIQAYQSMAHGFQVNLMPMEVLDRTDVFDDAAREVAVSKTGKGLDVYWVGNITHRLKRVNFVSMQSWVAHVGVDSTVSKQGYGPCRNAGFGLVPRLKEFEEPWKLCQKV